MPMSPEPGREPIFILSCYRTGSTLLRYVFDTHPEVYAPPELNLGQAAFQLAHLDAGLVGLHVDSKPEQLPAEIVAGLRATLGGRLEDATARHGKRRWCEKSPYNLATLGLLLRIFPEARFVCLYRHAFDVVTSLVKMIHRAPDLVPFLLVHQDNLTAAALDYWNQRTFIALAHEAAMPGRCVRVRYEDMVLEPAEVLRPVFTSLGLSWDDELLGSVFNRKHDSGMQDHYITQTRSIHSDSVGSGRNLALEAVPPAIVAGARKLLKTLGYADQPEPARAAGSAATVSPRTPRWLFETFLADRARTDRQLLQAIGSTYRFAVSGHEGGTWVIDPGQGRVHAGQSAACSIEVSANDLFAVAQGKLHPWKAAEEGRLRFQGDINVRELEALVRFLQLSPSRDIL